MVKLPTAKQSSPLLTAPQEKFAAHYAAFGDAQAAYQHAYNVETTRRASIQQSAYRVLHHPAVSARITALRNADAAGELASRERLMADLEALVSVSVEELMRLTVSPCAACWPTSEAWETAAATALDAGCEPTSADEPNAACKGCAGAGRTVAHITPTHKLSGPARRLFKGLELYGDGTVKRILLHDQGTLRTELHRLRGMHVDRSVALNLNAELKPLAAGSLSIDDAARMLEAIELDIEDPTVVSDQ